MDDPKSRPEQPESQGGNKQDEPAGPHAREDLTDYDKTPGTGSLPGGPGGESDIGPD
jgi:hypothetical protein